MIRTVKDRGRKRVFNTDFVVDVKIRESSEGLEVKMISSEVIHIGGKTIPKNFRFTCVASSDREQIEQFFKGLNAFNFLEVKSDKTLEFNNI